MSRTRQDDLHGDFQQMEGKLAANNILRPLDFNYISMRFEKRFILLVSLSISTHRYLNAQSKVPKAQELFSKLWAPGFGC